MLMALRSLPRTVWVLGAISLLNDSASELVYPLLPLYLSSVLMAGPRALGLIEGVAVAADWHAVGEVTVHEVAAALRRTGLAPPLRALLRRKNEANCV